MRHQADSQFEFLDWQFNPDSGLLSLHYRDSHWGAFTETFEFAGIDTHRYPLIQDPLTKVFDCLFWMAGVSYYKTSLAQHITFKHQLPDESQAAWLQQTWQSGLAELAYHNDLSWLEHIQFTGQAFQPQPSNVSLRSRTLVAIGGGKDSILSIELLKSIQEPQCLLMVGQSEFIKTVAAQTDVDLLQIKRAVDPKLKWVNEQGAYNGHVPITAIISCVASAAALVYDFDSVVFSNERSANEGNVKDATGHDINHQYSKSLAFEQAWQKIITQNITPELHCFSLLRPFSELSIIQQFAEHQHYFPYFSSCNRNFHLNGSMNQNHHWCGQCPKCAFVFLCMAPFVSKNQLLQIFKKDLLGDDQLHELFAALMGVKGIKPFECVGEAVECRTAMRMLKDHADWSDHPAVAYWLPQVNAYNDADSTTVFKPSDEHLIPIIRNFRQVINHENC